MRGSAPPTRADDARSGKAVEAAERAHMRRALDLAERGRGRVAPNPLVGAVVGRGDDVLGEGWHAEFGEEHAEVAALRAAGESARGAALFVTLEPCSHEGKTPPCTRAIVEAGIERVVFACPDPDPRAGGGAEELRRAGIRVEGGIEEEAAARQNARYLWDRLRDGPFVALKLALSLDGRIAAAAGERTAVTGEEARRFVHGLRAEYDAVLVGRRTAVVDDPLLTARGDVEPRVPAARVVLDTELRLPPESRLAATAREVPVVIFCSPDADAGRADALEERGVDVRRTPGSAGGDGLDLRKVFASLADGGISSVLVEGGGRLASSLLAGDLVRRAYLLYAPVFFGREGVEAVPGALSVDGGWSTVARRGLGDDTLLVVEHRSLVRLFDREL